MPGNLIFIYIFIGIIMGFLFGYLIRKTIANKKIKTAETNAEKILIEARNKKEDLLLKAKGKALSIIDDAKKEERSRRQEIQGQQKRLEKRESLFDQKILELQEKHQKLLDKAAHLEKIKKEITEIKAQQTDKLEKIAKMSKDEARQILLENTEEMVKQDILNRMHKLERMGVDEIEAKAKKMIGDAMQRCAMSHSTEITTTTVDLPNDEMKGRIIGREGRNIKAIEQLTGVEIIIDDTPQAITISGFSPIRRHVAKKALDHLILDGRIHPAKIEDAIEKSKKEIALEIKKAGEDAIYSLGITGLDPKLVQILGRLKFRTSYGQNVLQHSIEVAHLSVLLAQELGANVNVCRKGGLLHDIGKALDHEVKGGHPEIGYDIMKKYGLAEEIAYLSIAHHEDAPQTLEGAICKVADAISGSRPGARKDTLERYLQRLEELESVAKSFEGVEKCYAIQAGREIRVFVESEKIDDLAASKLARNIANKIESELKYPGEIKVNLIREKRIIEFAR